MSPDFDRLYQGVSHAAWAYFFLYFDFNFTLGASSVSILPKFAAYLLLWSAIGLLEKEERDLTLLRPLCLLLGLWAGAEWCLSWTGRSLEGAFLPLDLVMEVSGLYFQFQLFTDFAGLATRYQAPGEGLDRLLLNLRTLQVLLLTAMAAAKVFVTALGDPASWVYVALALGGLVTSLLLMAALFSLRKCFGPAGGRGDFPRRGGDAPFP